MSVAERRFWNELDRYHDLAKQYDQHVEVTHPDVVTSNNVLVSPIEKWCSWCASNVTYYEYRGPNV